MTHDFFDTAFPELNETQIFQSIKLLKNENRDHSDGGISHLQQAQLNKSIGYFILPGVVVLFKA